MLYNESIVKQDLYKVAKKMNVASRFRAFKPSAEPSTKLHNAKQTRS